MVEVYTTYKKQLTGEYLRAFQSIELYAEMEGIDFDYSNEAFVDLIDMLLSAQQDGQRVEKIVGSNIDRFCEAYFENYTWKLRVLSWVERVRDLCIVILSFTLFETYLAHPSSIEAFFHLETDISAFLVGFFGGALISMAVSFLFKKAMIRKKRFSLRAYHTVRYVSFFLMLIVILIFFQFEINLPVWMVLLFCLVYLLGFRLLVKRRRKKSKDGEESIWQQIKTQVKSELPESVAMEMAKEYERRNQRLVKKGKTPLSQEDYLRKVEQQYKRSAREEKLGWAIFVGIPLLFILVAAPHMSLEDTLIYAASMAISFFVVSFALRAAFKWIRNARQMRMQIVMEHREGKCNIFSLVENQGESNS